MFVFPSDCSLPIYSFSPTGPVLFSDYNNTPDSTESDVLSTTTTGEDDVEAEISFSKLFMRANPNRKSLCTDTSHRDCTRDCPEVSSPKAELIDPALKGTLNILGSCAKSPTVKRVVLTSSMAAVTCTGRPRTPDEITNETWFSNLEFCKEKISPSPTTYESTQALGDSSSSSSPTLHPGLSTVELESTNSNTVRIPLVECS
ncbi:Anthocyanidin reductase [Camellia lanceoleosa]|uniref:Anthocyanidin reductase n=1 Tax=Camellia lanceoleosa TaxID=1840588 RepID=A0ACC0F4R7_9ERIC|nr:Anthocyanidin reductase [Camellia lanceoleosa]